MNQKIDVRGILPAIEVPTLVMIRDRDLVASMEAARDIAGRIPHAGSKARNRGCDNQLTIH